MNLSQSSPVTRQPGVTVAKASNLPFVIRDYQFTQMIGKGGFAEVFLVNSIKFGTQFVAKVMTVDPSEIKKTWEIFDSETKALSLLNHPHIIRLYEHFQIGTQFYYILEYCPNGSLHDEINETCGLPYQRFLYIASQVVSALAFCHKKGYAHRDIKPANILLDDLRRAKISDFGLCAKTRLGQLHKMFSGSCEYTAPEIFLRKPNDPMRGDVWALGVVFAVMATGQSPWRSDSLGGLRQLAQAGRYTLSKNVPKEIADVIGRMLVVEPEKRITMEELAQMPLFQEQKSPMGKLNRLLSKAQLDEKLQWGTIGRPNVDGQLEDMLDDEEEAPLQFSKVRSASSLFFHGVKKSRVKNRVKASTFQPTFASIEEDVVFV